MNRYQIPYHKSIHDQLVRTILIPLLVISLILIVVVSLLTPAPEQEIVDEFDRVKAIKD